MKKVLVWLLVLAGFVNAHAQTLLETTFASEEEFEQWTVVDSNDDVDLAMVSISNPSSYVRSESKKDISFTLRSLSIKDVTAQVKVMIDEEVISETTETIGAQEIKQFELADKLVGVNAGKHTLKAIVTAEGDNNTANDIVEMEFLVLDAPVMIWNFEDGMIPAEFMFKVEDSGTVNSSAGNEFNENGWGLFNILENAQNGKHTFAGTTWLDGTDQADRWCVLPEIKVASGESFLVWDVASFNSYMLEDYSIMISSTGDDLSYYYTKLDVVSESAEFKTRGLDLSEYVNQNIFIAFRLRSKNCEALVLDNIGLYGGLELVDVSVSINDITGDASQVIVVEDDCVKANVAVKSMMLMDMSGKIVAQTENTELSLSHVALGMYVVKVTTDTEVITKKIVVK